MLTGRELNDYAFFPSSESEINMHEEFLPYLYYSLRAIVTFITVCTTFVLNTWQKRRCQSCVLHNRVDRLDTAGFPTLPPRYRGRMKQCHELERITESGWSGVVDG